MKKFIFVCILACATSSLAASIGSAAETTTEKREIIPVLNFETDKQPDGSFRFTYEGGDNSYREETGVVHNSGTEDESLEISGSYRYIDADGQKVEVHYTAGKNGFVPVGTNILSEISELAKAAALLPNADDEETVRRKARSQNKTTEEQQHIKVDVVSDEKAKEVGKPDEKTVSATETTPMLKKAEEKKPQKENLSAEKKEEAKKPVEAKKEAEKKPVDEKKPVEKKEEVKKAVADKKK